MKKRIFSILGTALLVFLGSYFLYQSIDSAANYQYSLKDVSYNHYSSDETFNVSVTNIRKEKNKEDVYEFDCKTSPKQNNLPNNAFDTSINLPKSDFEKVVGADNNAISGQVYVLELTVPAKCFIFSSNYYIEFFRYSWLDEKDFSDADIKELAASSLAVFTEANAGSPRECDLSSLKASATYTRLSLSCVADLDEFKSFEE